MPFPSKLLLAVLLVGIILTNGQYDDEDFRDYGGYDDGGFPGGDPTNDGSSGGATTKNPTKTKKPTTNKPIPKPGNACTAKVTFPIEVKQSSILHQLN